MKFIALSLIAVLLGGCSTAPKENFQQAYEASLADGKVMITTLRALDTGDIRKTRRIAMTSLSITLGYLARYSTRAHPTAEQKQEELTLARDVLDYMILHRDELDPRLGTVRMGMRGLQKILTQPGDTHRLMELSVYLTAVENTMTSTPKLPK